MNDGAMAKPTLPIIIGNRDFFPDRLVTKARRDLRALFQRLDVEPVILEMPPHRRRFWWTRSTSTWGGACPTIRGRRV